MTTIKDGGPAFPVMDEAEQFGQHYGLTMRDYFAAKALQGLCVGGTKGDPLDTIADLSYRMADAMIERSKT